MTIMPHELLEQLPKEIDPEAVVDHVSVGHAPGGGYGETHLVSHGGRLHVFSRGSMLSKFEQLPLASNVSPRLERGSFNSTLVVSTPHGEENIVLSMFEVDSAFALVGALHPDAIPRDPDAPGVSVVSKPRTRKRKASPPAQPPAAPPAQKAKHKAQPPPAPPASKPKPPPTPRADPRAEAKRFEKVLKKRPDDVVASLSLEEIYRDQGDYRNLARILLARVEYLETQVEQIDTMHQVAEIYAIMDEPANALEILQTAYLFDYENQNTVLLLEQLADEHNLWNKLLTGLNEEVQHHDEISTRAGVLVQMSRWYRKIYSRSDYADACLMHAKRLDPQHPDVLAALDEPG